MTKYVAKESGIAMPMAMVLVVLIGVMGAGLLAFVVADLDTVVEVNQGQRAMEMAETGIEAAKIQLQSKPDLGNYDSPGDPWFDDPATTAFEGKTVRMDSYETKVDIKPAPNSTAAQPYFTVTSDSVIGQTRRKVQAVFKAEGWGVKAYYTPGSIFISPDDSKIRNTGAASPLNDESLGSQMQDRVDMRGVSLFAGRDVVISDQVSITYARRTDTNTTRTDSVTGGGVNYSSSENYCIYQNDNSNQGVSGATQGIKYKDLLDDDNDNCYRYFPSRGDTSGELYGGSTYWFQPSSWDRRDQSGSNASNAVQPHIRITANASCPEIAAQWGTTLASVDRHKDALGSWVAAPFNSVARPVDNTQTYTNANQNTTPNLTAGSTSGPAPCQSSLSSRDLETYPSGAESYEPAGIAAEGKICRASGQILESYTDKDASGAAYPVTSGYGCNNNNSTAPSIANFRVGDNRGGAGRIGYDGTTLDTGLGFYDKKDKLPAVAGKPAPATTDPAGSSYVSDISYPFDPDQGPDMDGLYDRSIGQGRYVDVGTSGVPTNDTWADLYPPAGRNNKVVVFIDANGKDIEIPRDSEIGSDEETRGILVIRCGNLTNMRDKFNGIILVLNDAGPSDNTPGEQTRCRTGTGNYRSSKPRRGETGPTDVGGYVYAEGFGQTANATNTANVNGSDVNPKDGIPDFRYSIAIADASDINRLPRGGGYDDLTEIVGGGLQGIKLDSWRECYDDDCKQ